MYALIQGLAMVAYIITFIFFGKGFGFSKIKSLLLGSIAASVSYLVIILITWVDNGFTQFGAQNAVRGFVFFPFLIYFLAKASRTDYRKLCDFNGFPGILWYGLGHLACLTEGCCHGFAYYEGTTMYKIAYALTGTNMLPNQLVESIAALITAAVLLIIIIKKKYQTKGYTYFLMLIIYGTQRFFFEFFRDNKKVIVFSELKSAKGQFGISELAIWSLAMIVVGVVFLVCMKAKDKKLAQQAV